MSWFLRAFSPTAIDVHFQCNPCTNRTISLNVAAKSSIQGMVEAAMKPWQDTVNFPLRASNQKLAKPKINPWKVDVHDVIVQQDGLTCNHSAKVISFSLAEPFVLSKHQ